MLSFLIKILSFANLQNELFIHEHNSMNHSYSVEKNQFIDRNYTNEFFISENHLLKREKCLDSWDNKRIIDRWNKIFEIRNFFLNIVEFTSSNI